MTEKTPELTIQQKTLLVSGKSFWRTYDFEEAGVNGLLITDGPAGLRLQPDKKADSLGLNVSRPSTCFPAHSALACSFDKALIKSVGKRIGQEATSFGVNVLLAPAVNIKRNPLCGRNFEYFTEDPYLCGALAKEYIEGVQSEGVGACIKHFACNNKELGRTVYDSAVDVRTLREIYLTAFEIAITEAKPVAVMTAYNRLNGTFCNENEWLLQKVLREEWGHNGIVVSDWGGTYDRVSAIKAGADLEMPQCKFSANEITSALENAELSEEELTACTDRIEKLSKKLTAPREATACDFEEHAEFAVTCAESCAVLLKNDGVLPLNGSEKFVLIGEFAKTPVYQGGGSSHVNPTKITSLYGCLKDKTGFSGYSRGYRADGKKSKKLVNKALKLAKNVQTVIISVGLSAGDSEGIDRDNIRLPDGQTGLISALVSAGKKVIAVLSCGGAVETDWDNGVSALLFAGLNGQGGAEATGNILFGKANPSGKLAETFPLSLEDVPSTAFFNNDPYKVEYKEGMDVGYRYFYGKQLKYPFGFGLSYSAFEYSDLTVEEDGVSFNLKNTGSLDGAEVCQLYIGYPENAHAPQIQLKGFEKVYLTAGEVKRVQIPFDGYSFRSFNALKNKWEVAKGKYALYIGSSSEHLHLKGYLEKEGVEEIPPADTSHLAGKDYPVPCDRKGRVVVDLHTPFSEIARSRARLMRLAIKITLKVTKNSPTFGGTIKFAHVRTGAQFTRFDAVQADGLLRLFNGKYFSGVYKIIRGEKKKK
ncbi:MAG: glycosyl hydrolase [Clostridia bacterium]|nr:glycosyl hydrolase [Clostridia bacterium]